MPSTTARLQIPYPLASDACNPPSDMESLANRIDAIVGEESSGTFANRPAAGNAGFKYYATDTNTWYYDNGTSWVAINPAASAASSVTTSAVGDSPVVGVSTTPAPQDHKHGREAFAGTGGTKGSSASPARADHTHSVTVRTTAAYAIPGAITAGLTKAQGAPPDFYPGVPAGSTCSLAQVRFTLEAGTSVTFQITKNGSVLSGLGTLTATSAVSVDAVGVSIGDGDRLGLNIVSATSDAAALNINLYLDMTTTVAAS